MHPDAVLDAVHRYREDPAPVTAMWDHEVAGVLGYLGWAVRVWEPAACCRPLHRYVRTLEPFDGVEILSLARHYTAISYTDMVDTATMGEVVPLFLAPRMRCTLKYAMEVRRFGRHRNPKTALDPGLASSLG